MSRFGATLAHDVRLQARNGFYWAVAFVLAVLLAVVSQLPDVDWGPVLPPLILGNLPTATFFFMAGLLLLEKSERTLEAQVVSPLGVTEYLVSKLATITALSVVESVAIVLIANGLDFRPVALLCGIVSACLLYSLAGFAAVIRYDSINEMLFPTIVWMTVFSLPILHYAGLWSSPIIYLHPFQAPLTLLAGGFAPLEVWEWVYGLAYSGVWTLVAFVWSRRMFRRFVVEAVGSTA